MSQQTFKALVHIKCNKAGHIETKYDEKIAGECANFVIDHSEDEVSSIDEVTGQGNGE